MPDKNQDNLMDGWRSESKFTGTVGLIQVKNISIDY